MKTLFPEIPSSRAQQKQALWNENFDCHHGRNLCIAIAYCSNCSCNKGNHVRDTCIPQILFVCSKGTEQGKESLSCWKNSEKKPKQLPHVLPLCLRCHN